MSTRRFREEVSESLSFTLVSDLGARDLYPSAGDVCCNAESGTCTEACKVMSEITRMVGAKRGERQAVYAQQILAAYAQRLASERARARQITDVLREEFRVFLRARWGWVVNEDLRAEAHAVLVAVLRDFGVESPLTTVEITEFGSLSIVFDGRDLYPPNPAFAAVVRQIAVDVS